MATDLEKLYIAGLLHDTGKVVRKVRGVDKAHNDLSAAFIIEHLKSICGAPAEDIAAITLHHHTSHSNGDLNGSSLTPTRKISFRTADRIKSLIANNPQPALTAIIKNADSLSASGDRASENAGSHQNGRVECAPLVSVIGRAFGRRLTVRHGMTYETYEYNEPDETDASLSRADNGYTKRLEASIRTFEQDIAQYRTVNELDRFLSNIWHTVNPNTWRPQGATLGNTATSLYDHAKTTAAIAACLYIDQQNGGKGIIDVMRIRYNGVNADMATVLSSILKEYAMCTPNIIYSLPAEAMVMIPASITPAITAKLQTLNIEYFTRSGETLDWDIAPAWDFKSPDSIESRFKEHYFGALHVQQLPIENASAKANAVRYENTCIAGYRLFNYQQMTDYAAGLGSISVIATLYRLLSSFATEAIECINASGGVIISSYINECIYSVPQKAVHPLEEKIHNIYRRYVGSRDDIKGVTGLAFSYAKYDRYAHTYDAVQQDLLTYVAEKDAGEYNDNTYITFENNKIPIGKLNTYRKYHKKASALIAGDVERKGFIRKVLYLYHQAIYAKSRDARGITYPRFKSLLGRTKDLDLKTFGEECLAHLHPTSPGGSDYKIGPDKDVIALALSDSLKTEVET